MGCEKSIQVNTLGKNEAWELFTSHLGSKKNLTCDILEIAHKIVKECGGLPLAIIVMGSSMKAIKDIAEWRDTLQKLKDSKKGHKGLDLEVFPILKTSYDSLHDRQVQEWFLYCAVYPEDYSIPAIKLFYRLVDVGIIKEGTIEKEFNRFRAIINQLERASLLEIHHDGNEMHVKMHDLVRDMALRIKGPKFMVKSGIRHIPDEEEWTDGDSQLNFNHGKENNNLELVSLMDNAIEDISISPNCPNLSVLLLNDYIRYWSYLRRISNCFFEYLPGLRVLDLSNARIEKLPSSVGELVKLIALILRECKNLEEVPSLEKLTALRTLDLFYTAIKQVPAGLEKLVNLRYLDIFIDGVKVPAGILPRLYRLRYLRVVDAIPEEIKSLEHLEILGVLWYRNWVDYRTFVTSCLPFMSKLTSFQIILADGKMSEPEMEWDFDMELFVREAVVWVHHEDNVRIEDSLPIPRDTCKLDIRYADHGRSLSVTDCINLESCSIIACFGLEAVFSSPFSSGVETVLSLSSSPPPSSHMRAFSQLRFLYIEGCYRIKKVFNLSFLPSLPNLASLTISDCEQLEEIIATTTGEDNSLMSVLTLPKLWTLELLNLPNLESISPVPWMCDSLKEINMGKCPKLKKIPLSVKAVNGQLSPPPCLRSITLGILGSYLETYFPDQPVSVKEDIDETKRWWQSLEWDDANVERLLRPLTTVPCEEKVGRKLSEELQDVMSPNRSCKRLELDN